MQRIKPIIGQWYMHHDKGQLFSVVAIDNAAGTVEIQDFDGNLDEVDVKSWYEMHIEPCATPEDWTAPIDTFAADELDAAEPAMSEERQQNALESLQDAKAEPWQEVPLDEGDGWQKRAVQEPLIVKKPSTPRRSLH